MASVFVNKALPPLIKKGGGGGGSSQPLPPITDRLGRPLTSPVGSADADRQIAEANRISLERVEAQRQEQAQQEQQKRQAEIQRQAVAKQRQEQRPEQRTSVFQTKRVIDIKPTQLAPVRSIDLADKETGERVGGVTFRGKETLKGEVKLSETSQGDIDVTILPVEKKTFTQKFTQKISDAIANSKFGSTKVGQNVVNNLAETMARDVEIANRVAYERDAPIKEVYGKGQNLPAVVRSIFSKGGKVTGQRLEKAGVPYGQKIGDFGGGLARDVFFFAPTSSTTAQIEKELFSVSRVKIVGVTQRAGTTLQGFQKVNTKAVFKVTRAGRSVNGVVSVKSIQNQQAVISGAKGTTFTRAVEFPTTREIITPKTSFKGVEITKVTQKAGLSFSKSFKGQIRQGGIKENYRSVGVSKQFSKPSGKYITQIGATQSIGGSSFSTGLLKLSKARSRTSFRVTSTSGRANLNQIIKVDSTFLKPASLQATKNIIGASVKIPLQAPLNKIPVLVSAKQVSNKAVTQTITPRVTQSQAQQTNQASITKVTQAERTQLRTRTIQSTAQNQQQQQRQIPQVAQVSLQRQQQRQVTLQRTVQIQRQENRFFSIRMPVPRVPTPKIFVLPKLRGSSGNTGARGVKLFVKERGIFKFKGLFESPSRASKRGQFLTGTSISRSFKLVGGKAPLPKGFRTSRRQKNIFVELSKTALSQPREQYAVQFGRYSKRRLF